MTSADIYYRSGRIESRQDYLQISLEELKADSKREHESLHQEIKETRKELNEKIESTRQELHAEILAVRDELKADIKDLRSDMFTFASILFGGLAVLVTLCSFTAPLVINYFMTREKKEKKNKPAPEVKADSKIKLYPY